MSWAAHSPEAYDEICRKGIVDFIVDRIPKLAEHKDAIDLVLMDIEEANPALMDILREVADKEVNNAMGDHFGGLVDDATQRGAE